MHEIFSIYFFICSFPSNHLFLFSIINLKWLEITTKITTKFYMYIWTLQMTHFDKITTKLLLFLFFVRLLAGAFVGGGCLDCCLDCGFLCLLYCFRHNWRGQRLNRQHLIRSWRQLFYTRCKEESILKKQACFATKS